jgi:hypothetical protein
LLLGIAYHDRLFGVAAVTMSRSVDFNGRKLASSTLQAVLDRVDAGVNDSQIYL